MTDAEKTPAPAAPAPRARAPKAAPKTAETFEVFSMPKFEMPKVEMPEAFRDMTEKSVKQVKDGYEKMRMAAEEATDLMEDQLELTRSGFMSINGKALETAKASSDATFKLFTEMMGAKTVSDVIALQSAYAREQFELATASTKEMQELLSKFANDAAEPVKGAFEKVMKDVKAA
ncbi:phasin [Hartmannibacter diazotrophicus]|uniref:Phasin n=2 Tax=Hartmannibacter diazotrophicus TaxID=1482074 RepID=A0A2C9D2S3_9HYPH|nr:phasin [Hartmannibacter diazotrophicus]